MKTQITGKARRKIILKDWGGMAFEVIKWLVVLWLLWPIRKANVVPIEFTRVAIGILLFIIFAGKIFYDTVIMSIIRQRRMSAKKEIVSLIGIVVVLGFVVGLLLLFAGYLLIELSKNMNTGQDSDS